MKKIYFLTVAVCLFVSSVMAQDKKTGSYNLFRPVPGTKLRDMETDRPDVTESPITVDAGHFQYESDLFRLQRERSEHLVKNTYLFNQANLKLGLTGSTALQLVVQSYVLSKEVSDEEGSVDHSHGFGDLTLRIKQNLIGNDKGNFAIAILPYVKFPTSAVEEGERYEGGLILPMSLKLPGDWRLGMQVEADRLQDSEGSAMHTQLLESLTIAHKICNHLEATAETYYTYDTKIHQWNNFLNAALQVEVAKDVKLDGGLNYGLQHDAMKSYFVGLSFRL
ncbi:transporter [Pedobacter roseus]|uniref:Transporter n=1 Tax=Pedobacter roseus TaxID=336820 RepID=A0A7G9QK40_9SPHI|nr:transporter [Pedobacter roseus]QNN43715.1 transporter [Pedobacter roseus]